jgi:hypothetical protein
MKHGRSENKTFEFDLGSAKVDQHADFVSPLLRVLRVLLFESSRRLGSWRRARNKKLNRRQQRKRDAPVRFSLRGVATNGADACRSSTIHGSSTITHQFTQRSTL